MLADIGEILFSLLISYMGSLEFLFVVRHLYHWSFQHPDGNDNEDANLKQLQDRLRNSISDAEKKEALSGKKSMHDGVLYDNGFRIDPNQASIEELKNEMKIKESAEKRRKEIEAELERQRKIEEETRKKLKEAEEKLEKERKKIEEENARKLFEAEQEKELKQRQLKEQKQEAIENEKRILQAEKEREEKQHQLEAEREREQKQKILEQERHEAEENAIKLLEAEKEREEKQRIFEEQQLQDAENAKKLLEAERNFEKDQRKLEIQHQKEIEEMEKLMEAEKEMEEKQRVLDQEALQKFKTAQEEIELKQHILESNEVHDANEESILPTVKTQFGQTSNEQYSAKSKSLLFPGVSDESSSVEPQSSSPKSSFSTQLSSSIETANKTLKTTNTTSEIPQLHFDEYERQAPDGEDEPSLQYSEEYLRSLDGIKHRPLVREDGTGRRRAFKKRRSSGSSTSSRESRASREEELKMFTSLEEEELEAIRKGESEYLAIKYSSDPNLKVTKQHRRHKRSPAKDAEDRGSLNSLEMLDEEGTNPWGEVKPEHYKDTEFWKREKTMSIEEERPSSGEEAEPRILPKTSSFEEATKSQNKEVISTLLDNKPEGNESKTDDKTNRQISLEKEELGVNTAPVIAVDYASDDEIVEDRGLLMEGISDFYDFNASINPRISRSRSRSRSRAKSPAIKRSPSPQPVLRKPPSNISFSHSTMQRKSLSPSPTRKSYSFIPKPADVEKQQKCFEVLSDLSDFYDFNLRLNLDSFGKNIYKRDREAHRSSVDYIVEELEIEEERRNSLGQLQILIDQNRDGGKRQKKLGQMQELVDEQSDLTTNKQLQTMSRSELLQKLRRTPTTPDYDRTLSMEWQDVQKIKADLVQGKFKRSTYAGESMDFSDQFEDLRQEAREFIRSRSQSRSPLSVEETQNAAAVKRELQEKILDEISKTTMNFEEFSHTLNSEFLDHERRASDSALLQKPEILIQLEDLARQGEIDLELEGEEYHHFRRFSLNQETPIEEYPNDDYICISHIEVRTLNGRTWRREDYYGENLENVNMQSPINEELRGEIAAEDYNQLAEEESDESDDERQTVVEVEDEIDEDIWDYNERGPDESHHEQSECEEAEREMDRYAGKHADDWKNIKLESENFVEEEDEEEGAVGGVLDEDSFQIDQIYDEAIRNRKQSGIQRDYDSILQDIQTNEVIPEDYFIKESSKVSDDSNDRYAMWSSQRSRASSVQSTRSYLENERSDVERRYLGDATLNAINSTRLRSRYGIVPSTSLHNSNLFDTLDTCDTEINYIPKKEYQWRKNFKLDDDPEGTENSEHLDPRKLSSGGESITLFSQSPNRNELEKTDNMISDEENKEESVEMQEALASNSTGTKKKKNKRKIRKSSKSSIVEDDCELNENVHSSSSRRNSSSITEVDSPKNKTRSRRGSKSSIANEEAFISHLSPQNSFQGEQSAEIQKKKTKKRKKAKENQIVEEQPHENETISTVTDSNLTISTTSTTHQLSPAPNNILKASPSRSPSKSSTTRNSDAYDILKDGNMYPLF